MEKHRCKLCYRKFTNGRALGGHMRSHMINLANTKSLSEQTESASSSSSEDIDEDNDDKGMLNSMKSGHLDDLEDRESETESNRTNPTRGRSIRAGKPSVHPSRGFNTKGLGYGSDLNDGEQVSSISQVTSEEDVAYCLMMLSRDTTCWSYHERDQSGDIISTGDDDVIDMKRFRCETCDRVFSSYQALGGHRSSHKKTRLPACSRPDTLYHVDNNNNNNNNSSNNFEEVKEKQQQKKTHVCPVCFRVFKSGQALGGHKRSHGVGIMENNNHQLLDYHHGNDDDDDQSCKKMKKNENIFIDLNLPAPVEDEEISQIAVSAVSFAHL